MDLLDRTTRSVDMADGRRATYVGDHCWEISRPVRAGAARPDGVMTSDDVLLRLPPSGFERDSAERIIAAFGDS
jgi:hypothetical protein